MPIPPAITREDVLEALEMLDRGESADFGPPTRYEVLHAGKRYPPKAAIGFAATRVLGRPLSSHDFSGGQGNNQANGRLRALGFEIVARESIGPAWDIAVGATVNAYEDMFGARPVMNELPVSATPAAAASTPDTPAAASPPPSEPPDTPA